MLEDAIKQFLNDFRPKSTKCDMSYLVQSFATWLLSNCGISKFPVDIKKIIKRYQIPIQKAHLGNKSGFIIPDDRNIYLNTLDSKSRQNFTFGHEIFEKLFEALTLHDAPWLDDDELADLLYVITKDAEQKENWCDIGSSQLLMPMNLFKPYIVEYGFSLSTAQSIKRMTDRTSTLSLEAIIRRMLETALRQAALIIWRYDYKPQEISATQLILSEEFLPPKKLRVYSAYTSPNVGVYIPKHKSIELESTIGQAFQTLSSFTQGYDEFDIKSMRGNQYFVEATYMGADNGVYSLVYFDDVLKK